MKTTQPIGAVIRSVGTVSLCALLLLAMGQARGGLIQDDLCASPDSCTANDNIYGVCDIGGFCNVLSTTHTVCAHCGSIGCGCSYTSTADVEIYNGTCAWMYIFPNPCACNSDYMNGRPITVFLC